MAQPHQQYSMPQRPFSPPGAATSPSTPQQFGLPPNKRQRLSPNPPSQPGSPYIQSPYGMSPTASAPPSAGASPHFATVQLPQGVYNTPYSNGHTTPTLSLPQPQSHSQNMPHQGPLHFSSQSQSNHQFNNLSYVMPQQGAGTMGPPSKPADKAKEDGVDPMDVLGGTGIDLREEEQYTFQMYNASFNSQLSGSQSGAILSSRSFTQFPPGDENSVYGAGPANVTAEVMKTKSQDEFQKKAADKAWYDSARDLAVSRQGELKNPFLTVYYVSRRMAKIAQDNGVLLNLDADGSMGKMQLPEAFSQNTVKVQTTVGRDTALTVTSGEFIIPAYLVDQLALMSIATNHRLRGLLEDATRLARGRQTGSHGIVPADWVDVAAPSSSETASLILEGSSRIGWESALPTHPNPLKRPLSANKISTPTFEGAKLPSTNVRFNNEVIAALRSTAVKERDFEEARLRKRLTRSSTGDGTPRQGSAIPATPGSVAPEATEKAPTKKEQKKKAEAKVNEAASHAAANVTTAQFLGGGGGGGLFGKKKKYSWMTGGGGGGSGSASGMSTPGRVTTQGLPGTPTGPVVNAAPERLTAEGSRRLGNWREDKEKGMGVQMRDWIAVLEEDGHEKRTLQLAYAALDQSEPK